MSGADDGVGERTRALREAREKPPEEAPDADGSEASDRAGIVSRQQTLAVSLETPGWVRCVFYSAITRAFELTGEAITFEFQETKDGVTAAMRCRIEGDAKQLRVIYQHLHTGRRSSIRVTGSACTGIEISEVE
jgi:hypothetical protein